MSLFERFADRVIAVAARRVPDFEIGPEGDRYLLRWWLIPRNRVFNLYLHRFQRSDDDRALHDHPWVNASLLLRGRYVEHTISAGGVHRRLEYRAGNLKLRHAGYAHRVELVDGPCWSLFMTGPVMRAWGFHCPRGWVHWRDFTNAADGGATVGRGCDE